MLNEPITLGDRVVKLYKTATHECLRYLFKLFPIPSKSSDQIEATWLSVHLFCC